MVSFVTKFREMPKAKAALAEKVASFRGRLDFDSVRRADRVYQLLGTCQ